MIWIGANVVRGSRNPGGAGHTAKTKDRDALDIRRQSHSINQASIERRCGDAGYRRDEYRAQVSRLHSRANERVTQSLFTQLQSDFDPDVVRLSPRLHFIVVKIQGPRREPAIHLHAFVQAVENAGLN